MARDADPSGGQAVSQRLQKREYKGHGEGKDAVVNQVNGWIGGSAVLHCRHKRDLFPRGSKEENLTTFGPLEHLRLEA